MRNEGASFLLAVQFLTRVPVRLDRLYSSGRMAASVRFYPLVGALLGGGLAGLFLLAGFLFPTFVAVLITIAAGVFVTGAFHEDGLADTFDGIGGGLTREKALNIMKDSRIGTYGAAVLIMALALKVAALMSLPQVMICFALIAGHGLSRLSSVLVIATSKYVRDEGTGKPVAGDISPQSLAVALGTGGLIVMLWCVWQSPIALIWGGVGMMFGHGLMRLFFEPKLGGYTGDTLGAVQQASEIGFYLGLVAWL